jgi:hypothetical protein
VLSAVGQVVRIPESQMDAFTAVAGSGPAYVFLLAEALMAAGVAEGLPPATADAIVRGLLRGAGILLAESADSAAVLRERVTSPNGTTAAGLAVFEERGKTVEYLVGTMIELPRAALRAGEIAEAGEFLPEIVKAPLIPGVQGVEENGDVTAMLAWHAAHGGTHLKTGDARLALPGDTNSALAQGQYRVEHLARVSESSARRVYAWAWEAWESIDADTVEWVEDRDARRRFQRRVLAAHFVEPMTNALRRQAIGTAFAAIQAAQRRDSKQRGAQHAQRLERKIGDYLGMVEDLRRHGEDVRAAHRLPQVPAWAKASEAEPAPRKARAGKPSAPVVPALAIEPDPMEAAP